ncbi:TPA: hypothetical protein ACH3X1_002226 [Trebouxia sp. C0004]
MVSPDVMQDIDKLIDAAEKVEANLDMSTKQAKGQNQEQPQSERSRGSGRGQANYVDRNRGGHEWRECPRLPRQYMPAPRARGGAGRGWGRGRGMAGVSIYSSVLGAPTGRMIAQRFGRFGYGYTRMNTWEPYKNLKNAPDALNEYWDTVAVRAAAKSKKRGPDGYMAPVSKKLKGK